MRAPKDMSRLTGFNWRRTNELQVRTPASNRVKKQLVHVAPAPFFPRLE